ncbi:MAG: cytochrome c3 family protein [Nitrospirota bacterium]
MMNERLKELKTYLFLTFIFFIVVFLIPDISFSQKFPDCMKCHKDKAAAKYVHPVGCVKCHTYAHITGTKEKFPRYLFAKGVELCWGCHNKSKFTNIVEHPPVAKGECLSCHNVHTSDAKSLLLAPMPDECFLCHKNTDFIKKSKHPPVAEGRCMGCHDAHSSEVKKLLLAEMPKECFLCHKKEKYISAEKKKHHSPVATGLCLNCHEPHSSDANKLLLKAIPDVCFLCHYGPDFKNKYNHPVVAEGKCMSCHEPHQGDVKKLLLDKSPELCFNCHDQGEFIRKVSHPIVRSGLCTVCHDAHASPYVAMLYNPITDECLLCHPRIGKAPHAAGVFSKVGHPLKGRKDPKSKYGELTCASCHHPHSSDYINLFRFPAKTAVELCTFCHKYGKKDKK